MNSAENGFCLDVNVSEINIVKNKRVAKIVLSIKYAVKKTSFFYHFKILIAIFIFQDTNIRFYIEKYLSFSISSYQFNLLFLPFIVFSAVFIWNTLNN
jgi:hypothetical protein